MKATRLMTLGLIVVICFGLLWAFVNKGNSAPLPQNQQLTGNEKHEVDLATAMRYINNYKTNPKVPSIKGGFLARNAFEKLLAQPGVIGIRIYYAQLDDGTPTFVLVGVDANGKDMNSGLLLERIWPCPPFC